jgi:hypothetical protein
LAERGNKNLAAAESLFCPGSFAEGEDYMTTWLSNSNLSDRARRGGAGDRVVLYAALAVLGAIALYLLVTLGHSIPPDAAATFMGP